MRSFVMHSMQEIADIGFGHSPSAKGNAHKANSTWSPSIVALHL